MSVEPSVEIDKVSPVQLPLRLKESSDFVKESRCSFVKRTLLLLYGKIRIFRLDLVKLLIGNFLAQRLSASSGHLEGGHWPIKFSKGHFKRCLKRNKEMWCRMACELCANAFV